MSPTVFRYQNYRFFFFSREENRQHIHVISPDGEAKFWMKPNAELAQSVGFSKKELNKLTEIIKEKKDEINQSWENHFGHRGDEYFATWFLDTC
ncbi:MAG: DUF4160 domain-containing protein [Bacteroidales bacterium]|nr:DUF4160 domain-containing protein [Bacteroidales bacterium]